MVETSFYELRMKSVINVIDGKNLGHICDIVLEVCSGKILGFVVPGQSVRTTYKAAIYYGQFPVFAAKRNPICWDAVWRRVSSTVPSPFCFWVSLWSAQHRLF